MIGQITQKIMDLIVAHGGLAVFLGVIVESIIVPIPSPLIIMGAGAILIPIGLPASTVFLNIITKIVLPGAVASTIGAFLAYAIGYWGGKTAIDKFGKFLGFAWNDVLDMEKRIIGRASLMIFLLRALPIVPLSLISAVAGVLRIDAKVFTLWTFLGSLPRCLLLAYLGYFSKNTYESLAGQFNQLEGYVSGVIVVAVFAVIFYLRARMKKG